MCSKFNETVNQFKVGDIVKRKGNSQKMRVTGNIPGGGLEMEHYLKTDRYICEWIDENGNKQSSIFNGADLECA